MYKILAALLPFIKELFFNRKEEMDFTSYHFNVKRWIIYCIFLGSVVYSMTMTHRLFALNGKYLDMKRRYHKLEVVEKSDLEIIDTLRHKNEDLQDENNELMQKCLIDSRQSKGRTKYVLTPLPKVKNSAASK